MRSMALIVNGNEYFSQRPAVNTAAIDKVNGNAGYVLHGGNGLVKRDRVLRTKRLDHSFPCSPPSFIVEESLEFPGKENAKAAGEIDLIPMTPGGEWLGYQACFGH